eukprot:10703307-Ditylum_brightwellii.AAC.1
MTATTPNTEYKGYELPPNQIPDHFKVKETTPPPRVEINEPHIIGNNDNNAPQPALRVIPNNSGPHVISQCDAAVAQNIWMIPPYYVNAVYNETTGKMEKYQHLVKGQHREKWLQSFANELG